MSRHLAIRTLLATLSLSIGAVSAEVLVLPAWQPTSKIQISLEQQARQNLGEQEEHTELEEFRGFRLSRWPGSGKIATYIFGPVSTTSRTFDLYVVRCEINRGQRSWRCEREKDKHYIHSGDLKNAFSLDENVPLDAASAIVKTATTRCSPGSPTNSLLFRPHIFRSGGANVYQLYDSGACSYEFTIVDGIAVKGKPVFYLD